MTATQSGGKAPIIIKKYANRRLYNTRSSSYITLEDLARMTRENADFQVLDAKTGNDITHAILTQIIMDEEACGEQMLPLSFLRQLIGMYGNQMQALMPPYLEASMQHFRDNQLKLQEAFESSMKPDAFAKLARTNMAMFKAASEAFMPQAMGTAGPAGERASERPSEREEIDKLRAQMAEMQKKLDQLSP